MANGHHGRLEGRHILNYSIERRSESCNKICNNFWPRVMKAEIHRGSVRKWRSVHKLSTVITYFFPGPDFTDNSRSVYNVLSLQRIFFLTPRGVYVVTRSECIEKTVFSTLPKIIKHLLTSRARYPTCYA